MRYIKLNLCSNCYEEDLKIGDKVTTTSAEFDFCESCASFQRTEPSHELSFDLKEVAHTPSADPSRQWNGGEYAYTEFQVIGIHTDPIPPPYAD